MNSDKIAIIGMGCRFPGKLNDIESFWDFLLKGGDAVEEVPPDFVLNIGDWISSAKGGSRFIHAA